MVYASRCRIVATPHYGHECRQPNGGRIRVPVLDPEYDTGWSGKTGVCGQAAVYTVFMVRDGNHGRPREYIYHLCNRHAERFARRHALQLPR